MQAVYCGSRLSANPYRLCVHFMPVMNFTGRVFCPCLSAHPYRLCLHLAPVMNFTGCVLLFSPVCSPLQAVCTICACHEFTGCVLLFSPVCSPLQAVCTICACHEFYRLCIVVLACLLTPTGCWNFKAANLCTFRMDTQKYEIVISKLGSLIY